jgi:hypothetical protein
MLPATVKESYTGFYRLQSGNLLPIVRMNQLVLDLTCNKLLINKSECWAAANDIDVLVPHHLYIISDDMIEEGDYWVYVNPPEWNTPQDNIVTKNNLPPSWFENLWDRKNYKKVIATTDPTITVNSEMALDTCRTLLPSISQSYLEYYVEECNTKNKIEEVKVEYFIKSTVPFSISSPDRDRGYIFGIRTDLSGSIIIK